MAITVPIVYTLPECPACLQLRKDWTREGRQFEERSVEDNPAVLREALKHGDTVPIIVHPDGKVEVGYKDIIG